MASTHSRLLALFSFIITKKILPTDDLIWKITINMINRQHITGNGDSSFRSDYLYAQATYFAENPEASERMLANNTTKPFNEYLRIWYEHGLVGLFLFVSMCCLALWSSKFPISACIPPALESNLITGHLLIGLSIKKINNQK